MPSFSRILCAALTATALSSFAQTAPTPATPPAATPKPAIPSGPHPMNLDDTERLLGVGDPQVSPDGKWVLYTVSAIDTTADKRITS